MSELTSTSSAQNSPTERSLKGARFNTAEEQYITKKISNSFIALNFGSLISPLYNYWVEKISVVVEAPLIQGFQFFQPS